MTLPPLLLRGDCLVELSRIPDDSVDAIVTDPPYGLANTDPAHVVEALTRWAAGDRGFIPEGRGFMGKSWDAFVPPPAVWDEAMRILKPGGHLLAFAGSRTFDLMTLSIRFAGFDIRDSIAWLYGSGFPKSMDVSKAIDKLDAADERMRRAFEFTAWMRSTGLTASQIDELTGTAMGNHYTTHPTQPAIATGDLFDLLRPLLPAVPPEIEALVADRTVESENYAAREVTGRHSDTSPGNNMRRGLAGADRDEVKERKDRAHTDAAREWEGWGTALKPAFEPIVVARKPLGEKTVAANVLAHGTGALNIDASRIGYRDRADMDQARVPQPTFGVKAEGAGSYDYKAGEGRNGETFDPSKGRWPANVILDESQAAALDEQSGTKMSRGHAPKRRKGATGEAVYELGHVGQDNVDEAHAEATGGASRFFYVAKAPKSERPTVDGTAHPTVKPLALMRYLIRLVTPPGGCVIDPFAGSGTTLEAAYLEDFESIGVEMTPDYWPLIEARIERVTR